MRAPGSSPQEYAPNATKAVTATHRNVQLTRRFTLFTYELARPRASGKTGQTSNLTGIFLREVDHRAPYCTGDARPTTAKVRPPHPLWAASPNRAALAPPALRGSVHLPLGRAEPALRDGAATRNVDLHQFVRQVGQRGGVAPALQLVQHQVRQV